MSGCWRLLASSGELYSEKQRAEKVNIEWGTISARVRGLQLFLHYPTAGRSTLEDMPGRTIQTASVKRTLTKETQLVVARRNRFSDRYWASWAGPTHE